MVRVSTTAERNNSSYFVLPRVREKKKMRRGQKRENVALKRERKKTLCKVEEREGEWWYRRKREGGEVGWWEREERE